MTTLHTELLIDGQFVAGEGDKVTPPSIHAIILARLRWRRRYST